MAARPPRQELLKFLQPYGPTVTELALASQRAILDEEPSAIELIYDALRRHRRPSDPGAGP
jgi:hypothetical protein